MSVYAVQRSDPIRVKLMTRRPERTWTRQLPANRIWGKCQFLFDAGEREYDWLVVYDDLPGSGGERFTRREERLACPRRHTILVTTEPATIKAYGSAYISQFGIVLTTQDRWALPHPGRIFSQTGMQWYYGVGAEHVISYEQMAAAPVPEKHKTVSVVWSGKKEWYTLHWKRHRFMQAIRKSISGLDIYGRGHRPLDDKAAALDDYRYHISIENYIGPHHWTEKLSDPLLGYALPFYCGCPNVTDYFPAESVIPIDIDDVDGALDTIKQAIENNAYEKRLPAIVEARRRILEEYNFFAVIAREIEKRHHPFTPSETEGALLSRHALRKNHPVRQIRQGYEKIRNRIVHLLR